MVAYDHARRNRISRFGNSVMSTNKQTGTVKNAMTIKYSFSASQVRAALPVAAKTDSGTMDSKPTMDRNNSI